MNQKAAQSIMNQKIVVTIQQQLGLKKYSSLPFAFVTLGIYYCIASHSIVSFIVGSQGIILPCIMLENYYCFGLVQAYNFDNYSHCCCCYICLSP